MESQYYGDGCISMELGAAKTKEGSGGNAYLVNHHDSQQIAHSRKEQAVKVVANACTQLAADGVQDNLADDEEEDTEADVAEWPAVLQSAGDQQDLQDDVDEELDGVEQVEDDEQANSVRRTQTGP